jgi:hypothetical protein
MMSNEVKELAGHPPQSVSQGRAVASGQAGNVIAGQLVVFAAVRIGPIAHSKFHRET